MFCKIEPTFFQIYQKEIIATIIAVCVFIIIRMVANSVVRGFGRKTHFSPARTNLVMKYFDYLISILGIISLFTIWGVKSEQAFIFVSSILTVIGVAFFAQWSILSNITAGIILFFSFPFRIGDRIKIMDKDFPIEAEIMDIESFYTYLRTSDGEEICFPNNLLLQKGIVIIKNKSKVEDEFTD